MTKKTDISRRDFLKKAGATLIAAGTVSNFGALEALAGESPKKKSLKNDSRARRPMDDSWDVIIAGGGPAGCAAAIASAREGARTLLIESTGMLGGMSTAGNMNAWCPFTDKEKVIYNGIAEKILIESKKGMRNAPNDWLPINTEQLKRVYDAMVTASGAHVLLFSQMAEVEMSGNGTVDYITVANKSGLSRYKAKVYVDCTGDGDLAAWAGAEYFQGDKNGKVQASTLCFTIAGINHEEYRRFGGDGWLHSASKKSPIYKMLASGKYPHIIDQHVNAKTITPGVVVFNAGHVDDIRSTDPNDLTKGMMRGRLLVEELHRGFRTENPEIFGESFLASTGSLIGIRESRRIKGDYLFTVDDWVARRSFDDEIGRNCYYIDIHIEGAREYPRYSKGESHGIPFRTLVPEKLSNVLVAGRPISCDEYSFGSLRVMPVCLVTGEAAGLGAALASRMERVNVHDIDIKHLRKRLREEGQNIV
jgi:hypothetical protein